MPNKLIHNLDPDFLKVSLSNEGDLSFELLFKNYYPKILGYIGSIVKSKEISEELTHDIFIKIWSSKEILKEVKNLDSFLYKMAFNKAIDFLRATSKEKELRKLLITQMATTYSEPADHAYLYKEYEQQVKLKIKQLPAQQQLIFNLCREKDYSHQQVAEQLNLSKNTVKNHMVSAIKRLKRILKIFVFIL